MRLKLFKLLSLGLSFSMMVPTLVYATPEQEQITAEDIDSYDYDGVVPEEMAFPEYVVNEDTYEITDIAVDDSEDTEQRTFMDYFPDPNFAQGIAECFRKNKEDTITPNQLLEIKSLTLIKKNISSIEGIEYLTNLQYLDMNSNQIFEIPDSIERLTNLTILYLNNNKIVEIPESIIQLNLYTLGLSNNQIAEIPEFIDQLTNLHSLDLFNNQLVEISDSFGRLTKLQSLYLGYNQIREIPNFVCQLANLQELHLSYNDIVEIPDSIGQLSKLKTLGLTNNQIVEIPNSIGQLPNLQSLFLYDNQIVEIPDSIGQLTKLTTLNLSGNQIVEIPDSIGQLTNLYVLYLHNNQIVEIPDSIGQLTNLPTLYLDSNKIIKIPESIGRLTNLQSLHLANNQIVEISDSIRQLTNLQYLTLSNNQIVKIPESFGQLSNLITLTLYDNQIVEIPDSIGQLTKLQYLNLYDNKVVEIPSSIGELTNLRHLYLNSNQIVKIPDSIGQLTNLSDLDLSNNQITKIPDSISQLINLYSLYLHNNQIVEIPDSIGQLSNLQYLALANNQIVEIPDFFEQLTNLKGLYIYNNQIISELPIAILTNNNINVFGENQIGSLTPLHFSDSSEIIYKDLISPLILQTKESNNGILAGTWTITGPDGSTTSIIGEDGSEITPSLFEVPGKYLVTFQWIAHEPYPDMILPWNPNAGLNFNSQIEIEVGKTTELNHQVTLVTRYLDNAHPESTQTYSVEHGARFEQQFDVLDGYALANMELRTFPDFDVDIDTKTVSLDPVEKDYTIVLEFEKTPVKKHNVTVITRHLGNALPENTATYQVEHGASFLESFEVLEGYELYNSTLRSLPVFDVDMDEKTVGLNVVDRDYTIVLEFDKSEYKVKLNTSYVDNSMPVATQSDWVRYEESYIQTYEIAEGYQVANLDQLPAGVTVDENNHTVAINSVTQDFDIDLKFEKKQYNVTVRIVYEDGSRDEQVSTYPVPYGNRFETDFDIEKGYSIKKVSFNAAGVSVNRSRQEVTVEKVTSPVEIVIVVR